MNSFAWRAEIRRLIALGKEPTIYGAICGLILSWNSTNLLLVFLYAVSGLNCVLAFLTTTWFPADEHTPLLWVRDKLISWIGFVLRSSGTIS